MSFTPLDFTTSAHLYEYANWFHVASVMIMCNGDDFNFLATYDHRGYYGSFVPPMMERSYLQEDFNDTDENATTPIEPPVPPSPTLCENTDLSTIDLAIATITLDDGTRGISPSGGGMLYNNSILGVRFQKYYGRFYKYGKEVFKTVLPFSPIFDSATLLSTHKFIGMLPNGEYTLYQLPTMPAGNWIITSVGFVNAMFKTWYTETELVV
jgi:hypothetical protein